MKRLLFLTGVCAVAACGPTEDQIRADERAKVLEERVAELEAERDAGKVTKTETEAPEAPSVSDKGESIIESDADVSSRLIASYDAVIGQSDLFNSDGKRLTAPWQVLRQDRANFHRYNVRQSGDQSDPFFNSAKNRGIMERMVANGTIESSAGRRIMNGGVRVRVEIFGNGSRGQRVNVTVR